MPNTKSQTLVVVATKPWYETPDLCSFQHLLKRTSICECASLITQKHFSLWNLKDLLLFIRQFQNVYFYLYTMRAPRVKNEAPSLLKAKVNSMALNVKKAVLKRLLQPQKDLYITSFPRSKRQHKYPSTYTNKNIFVYLYIKYIII